jgi:peptide-methionine (S)-S-oxide reductase
VCHDQYRHGIYTHTPEQAEVAAAFLERQQAKYSAKIVTEIKAARVFYPAEGYHQQYLQKGGQSAEKNAPENVRCYG